MQLIADESIFGVSVLVSGNEKQTNSFFRQEIKSPDKIYYLNS